MFGKAVIAVSFAATALAQTFSIATPVSSALCPQAYPFRSHHPFDPLHTLRFCRRSLVPAFMVCPSVVHVADHPRRLLFNAVS